MPVPQHIKFLVGYAGEPTHILRNRQDACSTTYQVYFRVSLLPAHESRRDFNRWVTTNLIYPFHHTPIHYFITPIKMSICQMLSHVIFA